ncbi:hypothetical protein FGK63_19580 [Ruegeria sediminis]|uniref:Peptidase S8/S53 domain-containing protein n=1 Tax=Ruegeria sediminis TaxID=2583820 RepID=A0ABY2WTE3_9RHOB|nr:S8 family serine peptidase [Ruegeria sediminis]TMV03376.1 hypothetical protein FGK63_19580 [Ruegeria sediminis]
MTYDWTELDPEKLPRDPRTDFVLNELERFIAADLGLGDEDPDSDHDVDLLARRSTAFDKQWWMAVVSVARSGDKISSLTINELIKKAEEYQPVPLSDFLFVPREYDEGQRTSTNLDVITIYAQRAYLDAVNAPDGEEKLGIRSILISTPLEDETLNPGAEPFAPPDLEVDVNQQTVVVAVIDHGIAIAHDLFRRRNGAGELELSRIDFFWDMDGAPEPAADVQSSVGRVWTRREIQNVLDHNIHNGLLDEAAVYRELGLIDWRFSRFKACAQRVSHGTHVMGLAAGYPPDEDTGEDRRIIAVQLPTRLVGNTSGNGLKLPLEQALRFIAARLSKYKIGRASHLPPLVMNFSFGNFMGPHDGTGEIERAIDKELTDMSAATHRARLLLLPSGNGNLSQCHAVINLTGAAPRERLDWNLQPADRSASFLDVWLPVLNPVPNNAMRLKLKGPGSVGSITLPAGMVPQHAVLIDTDENGNPFVVAALAYRPPSAPTFRGKFTVMTVPTDHPMNVGPVAPSGKWKLTFKKGAAVEDLALNVWVQRDDTLPGFPEFGRQSYLSDARYRRFGRPGGDVVAEDPPGHDSPVCRAGMINGIACGNLPAVVAGFVRSDGEMADYSAGGPTLNGLRLAGPDASAVSDDSVALSGVLSAGSSSGSRVPMNGTSVATPQVARWAADQIAASPTTPFGRAKVVAAALNDDPPSPRKPSILRTGGGRLSIESVFGQLRWPGQ